MLVMATKAAGSVATPGAASKVRIGKKSGQFLKFYFGEARGDATEAARLMGLRWPHGCGKRYKERLWGIIQEHEQALFERTTLGIEEAQALLAEIARSKTHKDQLKALELVLRIHGLLDVKLDIKLDAKSLQNEIFRAVDMIRQHVARMPDGNWSTDRTSGSTPKSAPNGAVLELAGPQPTQEPAAGVGPPTIDVTPLQSSDTPSDSST